MHKSTNIFTLTIFLFLLSCHNSPIPNKQNVDTPIGYPKKNIWSIIDTAKKGYPCEIIKTPLNNDTIQDYFVIDHSGLSYGSFFDGKTGNEIPTDGVNIPWSRPGVEMEYKIIDVLCKDVQKEILVKGGSGGTIGLNLTSEIYRFDSSQNIMKLIFSMDEFSSHADKHYNDVVDAINYINLRYKNEACNISIYTCKGKYKGNVIIPVKKSKATVYNFNEAKNIFESIE